MKSNPSHYSVYETLSFTPNELQELLSFFDSTDSGSPPNSGSDGSSRSSAISSPDEMSQRRKTLNRESARRSRSKRQRHVEDLTGEVNRMTGEIFELKKQLGFVSNQGNSLLRENECLVSESVVLTGRLLDLCSILSAMDYLGLAIMLN